MAKKKEENAAVETEETKAKFREKLKSLLELGKKKRKERRALDAFVDPAMFGFDEEDWDEEDS